MSWLGRAAVAVLLVGVVLAVVPFAWGNSPSWLGFAGVPFLGLGVILVLLWTAVRLYTAARLRARPPGGPDARDEPGRVP